MTGPRPRQSSRDRHRKWTDKLADIATAIRDHGAKEDDPIAAGELHESKKSNKIQFGTLIVTAIAALFAFGAYREARRTVDVAQQQLTQSTRAWLSFAFRLNKEVGGAVMTRVEAPGDAPALTLPISNSGESPALKVRHLMQITYEMDPPVEPDWTKVEASRQSMNDFMAKAYKRDPNNSSDFGTIFTVFPGNQQRFFSEPLGMSPDWLAEYVDNRRILYVWARVDYCDIFGKPHWTKACAFHAFSKNAADLTLFPYCRGGGIVTDTDKDQPTYTCG